MQQRSYTTLFVSSLKLRWYSIRRLASHLVPNDLYICSYTQTHIASPKLAGLAALLQLPCLSRLGLYEQTSPGQPRQTPKNRVRYQALLVVLKFPPCLAIGLEHSIYTIYINTVWTNKSVIIWISCIGFLGCSCNFAS